MVWALMDEVLRVVMAWFFVMVVCITWMVLVMVVRIMWIVLVMFVMPMFWRIMGLWRCLCRNFRL